MGRLKTIVFACFWAAVGAALQTSAQNVSLPVESSVLLSIQSCLGWPYAQIVSMSCRSRGCGESFTPYLHTPRGGLRWILEDLNIDSRHSWWHSCARVITGIGTGQLNALVPVWTSELSHHSGRGAALGFECQSSLTWICVFLLNFSLETLFTSYV